MQDCTVSTIGPGRILEENANQMYREILGWSGKRENKLLTVNVPSLYLGLCEEEEEAPISPPASAGVAAALFPGTLQAGETYGNVVLLLLGKQGALGLHNEPGA